MYLPIFSKRHKKIVERKDATLSLTTAAKRRILYSMQKIDRDVCYRKRLGEDWEDHMLSQTGHELLREHGWEQLRVWDSDQKQMTEAFMSDFLLRCAGHHALDAIELFSRLQDNEKHEFQKEINKIFYDASLPWRLADDVIFRVDSEYMSEVYQCASQLLTTTGFEGALEEFQKARSHLDSGDTKESVHHANLSLESTMKSILGVEREKPGKLIRLMIDSGIVPAYYDEFLHNFEQILRSVTVARNEEPGAGHGQGAQVNEVPHPLAELVLNLCGSLTVYLVRQRLETNEKKEPQKEAPPDDEIPF